MAPEPTARLSPPEIGPAIVAAAEALATRVGAGGRLWIMGSQRGDPAARHIEVEFLHPVVVGKRAVAAEEIAPEALASSVGPGDVVIVVATGPLPEDVRGAAELAGRRGTAVVELCGGSPAVAGATLISAASADRRVAAEWLMTGYHLLWEAAQLLFEAGSAVAPVAALMAPDPVSMRAAVVASVRAKLGESAALRREVLISLAPVLDAATSTVVEALASGQRVICFGNGGSATDAADAVASLTELVGPGAARCLDAPAPLSAIANDVSFTESLARAIEVLGRPGDVAFALSTSGSSPNIVRALEMAHDRGMRTVTTAGYHGGSLAELSFIDHLLVVPSTSVHRIQEAQATLHHVLWEQVAAALARRSGG